MDNAKQCPYCSKTYGRAWTLARHIETQHGGVDKSNSSEEESIAEESEASGEEDSSSEQSEENEELHDLDIQRIRNLIAMAELGDISLTKSTLTSLIDGKQEKPNTKETDSEDSMDDMDEPYKFRHLAISSLREMLTAVKQKQMILTKKLYFDIIDSLDLTGRAPDPEEEEPF